MQKCGCVGFIAYHAGKSPFICSIKFLFLFVKKYFEHLLLLLCFKATQISQEHIQVSFPSHCSSSKGSTVHARIFVYYCLISSNCNTYTGISLLIKYYLNLVPLRTCNWLWWFSWLSKYEFIHGHQINQKQNCKKWT